MRLCILLLLLIFSAATFAETKISATLPKGSILVTSTTVDRFHQKQFPLISYEVNTIATAKFKLLKSDDKSLDMSDYNLLFLKGKLDLITYDAKTEHYQFKFTFLPTAGLYYFTNRVSDVKGKEIKGNVFFDANNKSSIILEGEMNHSCTEDKTIPSKDVLFMFINTSELKDNSYLMFLCTTKKSPNEIIITTSYDIPITIRSAS